MTSKYTPGPWKALPYDASWRATPIIKENHLICRVFGDPNEANANARLIAAAPDTAAERDWLKADLRADALKLIEDAEADEGIAGPEFAGEQLAAKIDSLKAINAELVEALLNNLALVVLKFGNTDETADAAIAQADAILAKHKGGGS